MATKKINRLISRDEFACLRAHVQGMELSRIRDVYLTPDLDLRVLKSTLRRVNDQVKIIAQRHGKNNVVRLVSLRLPVVSTSAAEATEIPTLEDFRLDRDPQSVYTERELTELFKQEYPESKPDRKTMRDQRLRDKQIEALIWAETMLVADPSPADPPAAWLPAHWAKAIENAGYKTLESLAKYLNERGTRWHTEIPKLGQTGADYVASFLEKNANSIGVILTDRALVPRRSATATALLRERPKQAGIVPLEAFICPTELSGTNGTNRIPARPALCNADDDLTAVKAWVDVYKQSPNTQRAYRKEVERLLLWCVFEAGVPMSSLLVENCEAYQKFLGVEKSDKWAAPRGAERWSPDWRPFDKNKPLSLASQEMAIQVCAQMFSWLVDQQYLAGNPFRRLLGTKANAEKERDQINEQYQTVGPSERTLDLSIWALVENYFDAKPKSPKYIRAWWLLEWGRSMGLRAREMVDAKCHHISRLHNVTGEEKITFLFVGKGNKHREVPIPAHLLPLLSAHLVQRGLDPDVMKNPGHTYLVGRVLLPPRAPTESAETPRATGNDIRMAGISYESLYKIVKGAFEEVLIANEAAPDEIKAKLKAASTHWLRHCFGAHSLAMGMTVKTLQDAMGHSNTRTTNLYAPTELVELNRAMEEVTSKRLSLKKNGPGAAALPQQQGESQA